MHPFETVFLKASWQVGEPFVDKYSAWMLAQVGAGRCGRAGGRAGGRGLGTQLSALGG